MKQLTLTRRQLLIMFLVSMLVSLAGVFFAYHTEITSSNAWIKWGNDQAWIGDSFRLLVLTSFASLLILVSFSVERPEDNIAFQVKMNTLNILFVLTFIVVVTLLNFYYYPIFFKTELLDNNKYNYLSQIDLQAIKDDNFGQVYKPFFAYYFYSLPLWCFIIMPTFLIFLDGSITDYQKLCHIVDRIKTDKRIAFTDQNKSLDKEAAALEQELSDLREMNDDCILAFRTIVQRYFPGVLLVLIGFTLGNLLLSDHLMVGGRVLVPAQTPEAQSSIAWVIILFLIICSILIGILSYRFNQYRQSLANRLDLLIFEVKKRKMHHQYRDAIKDDSEKWDLRKLPVLTFLFTTLVNTGTIYLPLLLSIWISLLAFVFNDHYDTLIPISMKQFFVEHLTRPIP